MTTPLREKFEKAFAKQYGQVEFNKWEWLLALWAAKWMAEYILNNTDAGLDTTACCKRLKDGSHLPGCGGIVTDEIRTLAASLDEERG